MSSSQTMTAPAAGHRPPDPGIDIAASSNSTSDAIVDNHHHDFIRAANDDHSHDYGLNTDAANKKQNGSVSAMPDLPRESPVDINKEKMLLGNDSEKVNEVIVGGEEENEGEHRNIDEERETKEKAEVQDSTISEEPIAEKSSNDNQTLQDREKQSAATSLLAQLLENIHAQPAAPATPENLPQTPLPEPLTDVSTPAGTVDDSSMPLLNGQKDDAGIPNHQTQADTQNGIADPSNEDENPVTTKEQSQSDLQIEKSSEYIQSDSAAAQIAEIVTGVMEDPLSKTGHDHNGLFAPFDANGAIKNGLDLQQHDLLTNTFLSQEINMSGLPDISGYSTSYNEAAASIAGSEPRIQAFAKLEFDDGHFYVNTYSFILGRDVRAARAAFQREVQARQVMGRQSKNKSSSGGNTSHTPNRVKHDGSAYMGSVVSDRGGIMGFDPDVPHHISQMSRRSSVSSQPDSVLLATPAQLQTNHTDYNALAMESLIDGNGDAKPVDMLALLPSPDACPTIPIHPPATVDGSAAGHKGISRKHVKIAYNFDRNLFEMEVMGRNGAFIGADWLAPGQVRPLHSGDYIQIGGVRIRFLLPDVPIGETGADRLEESLVEGAGDELTGKATEVMTGDVDEMEEDSDIDSQDDIDKPRVTKFIIKTKAGDSANADASIDGNAESQPKRRGPGRPPKDGIMSKRERAEIAREQKMAAKREANGGVTPPPANRIKPPKPRKEDSVEEVAKPVEKKKFVKRKQSDGMIVDVPIESIEYGEQLPPDQVVDYPKPPPPKKRKPSRSPSPDYPPESSYTQEQLAKPPYNYAVLIFDALTESQTPMTLKQIYRALKLKYPYFRFKCETEGWTSSVRHNLNGNRQLFEHAERDGKGWSWQLRAGASVEKEKKRRPSPPPPPPSTHVSHQPGPHQQFMPPPNLSYPNQTLQNQQFQFSAVPSPPPPQPNSYPRPLAPPTQASSAAPFRNINLPPALSPHGPSNYVSPYPCALPPDILQLQQENQPLAPRPTMDHQRQPDSAPPPQQHQQLQQSNQQQQPPSQFTPNVSPYPPPVNNQMHQNPQPSQVPPSLSQQPTHEQQQLSSSSAPTTNNGRVSEPEPSMSFLERANKAIDDFEAVLMEDYDDKDYIREVLKSARARALGHAEKSSFPDGEPKDEAVLLNALRNLIGSLKDE